MTPMDGVEAAKAVGHRFHPLDFDRLPEEEMLVRSRAFLETMRRRRSVRRFSSEPVGYPAADAEVPAIERKPFDAVLARFDE